MCSWPRTGFVVTADRISHKENERNEQRENETKLQFVIRQMERIVGFERFQNKSWIGSFPPRIYVICQFSLNTLATQFYTYTTLNNTTLLKFTCVAFPVGVTPTPAAAQSKKTMKSLSEVSSIP